MEMLKRKENESESQYIKRLIYGKLVDKTIDLDYSELTQLMYGKPYSSDVGRRICYGWRDAFKLIDEENLGNIKENDIIKQIEEKSLELEKEKIKVRTEKLELNKSKRIDVRNEMLYEEFKRSLNEVEIPNFKPIVINSGDKIGHLGISDFHFGKAFSVLNNEYNEEIFYNRMNKLISETVEICRQNNITKLHILNCGDDVEGMALRVSQLKSLQYGFTDQVIKLAKYMVKFLNKLSEELEIVYHHVLEGNHSELRTFNDRTWTCENMERIIITYIRDTTENNPRISIPEYNGQFVQYDIFGYNIYARHGHRKINENKVIGDVSNQLRKFIDYVYFGHLHHYSRKTVSTGKTNNKEVIYLPSIMGEDEYSQDFMFGGSKASAILDVYEKDKGIKNTYNIIVN